MPLIPSVSNHRLCPWLWWWDGRSQSTDTYGSCSMGRSFALKYCGLESSCLFLLHKNSRFWNPCYFHHTAGWIYWRGSAAPVPSSPIGTWALHFPPCQPQHVPSSSSSSHPSSALPVGAVAWRPACNGQLEGKQWLNNLNCHLKAVIVIVMWQVVTAETATHSECNSL